MMLFHNNFMLGIWKHSLKKEKNFYIVCKLEKSTNKTEVKDSIATEKSKHSPYASNCGQPLQ